METATRPGCQCRPEAGILLNADDDTHVMPLGVIQVPVDEATKSSEFWSPETPAGAIPSCIKPLVDAKIIYVTSKTIASASTSTTTSALTTIMRVYLMTCSSVQKRRKGWTQCLKYWDELVRLIKRSRELWFGELDDGAGMMLDEEVDWPFVEDERSLSDLYNDILPPNPEQTYIEKTRAIDPLLHHPLHSFQRSTIARLLQQEESPIPRADPTYLSVPSLLSHTSTHPTFFVQLSSLSVQLQPPTNKPQGAGILSEEMGAGKTLIAIGLILSTKGRLSAPPANDPFCSSAQTVISLKKFRSSDYYRNLFEMGDPDTQVPSLVENMLHYISTHPLLPTNNQDIEERVESSELGSKILPLLHPFFFEFIPPVIRGSRTDEKQMEKNWIPRMVYLSSATLVVVPKALYQQWKGEIWKFCRDGVLETLFMEDGKEGVVDAKELAKFDLVLVTAQWLSSQHNLSNLSALHTKPTPCKCPPNHLVPSVSTCVCPPIPSSSTVSPIFRIRWRRVVVDEGHNTAHLTTNYSLAVGKLSVENKWIVSGTPTQQLIGSVTTTTESTSTSPTKKLSASSPSKKQPQPQPSSPSPSSSSSANKFATLNWTEEDDSDLKRLQNMISQYLGFEPFISSKQYFENNVLGPLRTGMLGGKSVLGRVMEQVIFRHPIEVVESEVGLQPMTQSTILLNLEPFQLKTYNVIQSTIVTNAVDSERTDEDYMFHPRNAKSLNDTIQNLFQALFWHADADFFHHDMHQHLRNSHESVERAKKRGTTSLQDMYLLIKGNQLLQEAILDQAWGTAMQREDVPYLSHHFPPAINTAWSRFPTHPSLHHPDRLLRLRDLIVSNPDLSEQELIEKSEEVKKEDALKEIYVGKVREQGKVGKTRVKKNPTAGIIKARTQAKVVGNSPLFNVKVSLSSSSKINYIIQEVLHHSPLEKFLIFSSSPLSLLHLAESLQLANISFLDYTSECTPKQRQANISLFCNVEIYRVFLMEVKLGARGLNLAVASRIIFCEPVWALDVEAQAIKRAHRTGQTRPIVVKTLAIRGTVEEEMMNQRAKYGGAKVPGVMEDIGMRKSIEYPKYLEASGNDVNWELPLVPVRRGVKYDSRTQAPILPSVGSSSASPAKRARFEDPSGAGDEGRPEKRSRFVSPVP